MQFQRNITQEIQKIFDGTINNLWDTEYEKNFRLWTSHVPTVMFWFGITLKYKNASRILDIGCGCGRNSSYLAKMGFSVTGIDMSSTGIQKAGECANLQNLKSNNFVRANAADLPFKKNFFDGIICLFTLSFLDREESEKSISEMQRVLHKNGKICITEQVSENLTEKQLMELLGDFKIIESWQEAMPLLSRSSLPLQTVCIVAEKQSNKLQGNYT